MYCDVLIVQILNKKKKPKWQKKLKQLYRLKRIATKCVKNKVVCMYHLPCKSTLSQNIIILKKNIFVEITEETTYLVSKYLRVSKKTDTIHDGYRSTSVMSISFFHDVSLFNILCVSRTSEIMFANVIHYEYITTERCMLEVDNIGSLYYHLCPSLESKIFVIIDWKIKIWC